MPPKQRESREATRGKRPQCAEDSGEKKDPPEDILIPDKLYFGSEKFPACAPARVRPAFLGN